MESLEKYRLGLAQYIRRKIDDEGVVEELTNEVMHGAYLSWGTFNRKCSEFSFICSIANHKVVDYYRKKKLKTVLFSASPIFEEIADEALSPERDVLKNELKAEIEKTFLELKAGYDKILRLKYVEGLRTSKIAQLLNISVKAVESKLVRARRQFQTNWQYDRKKAKETVEADSSDHHQTGI